MIYINESDRTVFSVSLSRSAESFFDDLHMILKDTVTDVTYSVAVQKKASYMNSLLLEADFNGVPCGEYEYKLTSADAETVGLLQVGSVNRPKTVNINKEYKCYGS